MRVLIVDDQEEIIQGIISGIDWKALLQIEDVLQATSAAAAKQIFGQTPGVELLITDIEMPGESGLDLISWVNQNHPDVKCILLTAHAKFTYAQDAVRLQCVDYILQPVQYSVLQAAIEKAIIIIEKEHELKTGAHSSEYWDVHREELEQKYWLDYLSDSQPDEEELLAQMMKQKIHIPQNGVFVFLIVYALPSHVQLEEWNKQSVVKAIMSKLQPYIESFSTYNCPIYQKNNRCSLVCITDDIEEIAFEKIQAFSNLCSSSYGMPLSIFFGCAPSLKGLPLCYREMEELFGHTLVPKPGIYHRKSNQDEKMGVLPNAQGWCDCFVNKNTMFIWDSIKTCIRRNTDNNTMNRRTLWLKKRKLPMKLGVSSL